MALCHTQATGLKVSRPPRPAPSPETAWLKSLSTLLYTGHLI